MRPESLTCTQDDEPFYIGVSPLPGFEHLPFKAALRSVAQCQVSNSLNSDLSTQCLIAEMIYTDGARSYRFNHTRLPRKKNIDATESHKVNELYEFLDDSSRD